MKSKTPNLVVLFLLFWAVTVLLYWPARNAHFTFDFNMWALHYDKEGIKGLLYSFTDKSLHHIGHLLPFLVYKGLGLNPLLWFFALTFLHTVNAILLYVVMNRLFRSNEIERGQYAIVVSVLFLLSPLHTEVVIWGSAMWYLTILMLLLVLLALFFTWFLNESNKTLVLLHVVFVLALYTWELALVFPLILALYYLFFFQRNCSLKRYVRAVLLPQGLLCTWYFVHNILRTGQVVSHYGESTHLKFSPPLLATNFVEYFCKLSNVEYLVSYRFRNHIIWQDSHVYLFAIAAAIVALLLVWIFLSKKTKTHKLSTAFVLTTLILLLPVINIPNCFARTIEQDRYLYAPSAFFSAFVVSIMMDRKKWLLYSGIGVFVMFSLYFQQQNVASWKMVGEISKGLNASFQWKSKEQIVILASCDNVNGAYCMRSQPYCSFAEAYTLQQGCDIMKKTREIVQFDMHQLTDTFIAEKLDKKTYKLTFAQWGNAIWKNGIPFQKGFSDSFCTAKIDEWGHSIVYTMNESDSSAVYIYQNGMRWIRLN